MNASVESLEPGLFTKIYVEGPSPDNRKAYYVSGDATELLEQLETELATDPQRRIAGIHVIDRSILDLDSADRDRLYSSPVTATAYLLAEV